MSQTPFDSLPLQPALVANLATLGYREMTPIQAQSLPHALAGKDIIAQAKTGSGKTAAFGLGLLQKLQTQRFCVQALVLCPTRELADQVAKELRKLARSIHNVKVLTLCGGTAFGPQIGSLEHGAHIVVGTPGRVADHLRKGTLKLDAVETLVLDEADRMLEMGFQPTLDAIVEQLPRQRQNLLFSATYPEQIQSIAKRIMRDPVRVEVEGSHDSSSIAQRFFQLSGSDQRAQALRLLLLQHRPETAVVFCNTRRETQEVATELCAHGFSALALHGELEQRERDQTLVRFANKSASVLVATDVAARGLDIDALDMVVNYHLPRDAEVYVHRIGRTGRAGGKGMACSFYTDKESYKLARLEDYLEQTVEPDTLPPVTVLDKAVYRPLMTSLQIDGGKKQKLRPGDILGALTGDKGILGKQVGKIHIFDHCAYVAVNRDAVKPALKKLSEGKMKGRSFRVRQLQAASR